MRFCLSLWVALQIVYTPIHLYHEPHSDDASSGGAAPRTTAAAFIGNQDQSPDGHHERHPGAQHKIKLLRPQRVAPMDVVFVAALEWEVAEKDCLEPQPLEFSGLSPPELSRCWQFAFRAALPVRAPSLHS